MSLTQMACGTSTTTDLISNVNGLIESTSAALSKNTMIESSQSQSSSSISNSLITYQDIPTVTESWSDLSSWVATSPVGVQVSNGRLYSIGANSGKNAINYPLGLTLGENFRAEFVLRGQTIAGSSGGVMIGFDTQSSGATPSSGGTNLYGLYFKNAGEPQKVVSGSLVDLEAGNDPFDRLSDYIVTVTLDSVYLSIVASKISDGTEVRYRSLRSAFAPNNFQIFNSDAGALGGMAIDKLYMSRSVKSFTIDAQYAPKVWTGDSLSNFKLYLPVGYDSRKPLNLCIGFHGNGSDENHWSTNTNGKNARAAIVGAGFAFLGCTYATNKTTWGAQSSLDSYYRAYEWFRSKYPLGSVVFYGNSMGGIESLLAIAEKKIPNVRAWAGTNPTTNLSNNYENALFTAAINTAYGISGANTYDIATAGHDPILKAPSDFYAVPMIFVTATDDTVVSPSENTDRFISEVATIGESELVVIPSGGHSANFQPYMQSIIDFYNKYI